MYYNFKVEIPDIKSKIYPKIVRGVTYINYEYDRIYKPDKKYNIPKRTTIGKVCDDNMKMMYPNTNYHKYFPDAELPVDKAITGRSCCLRIGAFLVIRKIIEEYGLDKMICRIIGRDSGLFLDLVSYSIITENNAGQYYPDYAYNHPLFTNDMQIYSDSKVSEFISAITADQITSFLNEWNESRDHRERIYISYDSTNKNCQAGDIEIAEFGRPKDGQGKPIFNYSVAYDRDNREPLFYEEYPGSIVDVSQLQHMLEKAKGYGYKRVGFILDRGYFSEANIQYMDGCGYDFIIMVKGLKKLVSGLILENRGTFEESRQHSIREYRVSGITVRQRLFQSDEKERYFHIYYSSYKYAAERETVESKMDRMVKYLSKQEGKPVRIEKSIGQYFDLFYYHEGQDDEKFLFGKERVGVVEQEIHLCGYFAIITSRKMTSKEALCLYKSRDASEKLFRGDKSFLGNGSLRVHSDESAEAKIFIEFVALIIRNRIYTCLKDKMEENARRLNYLTVPAALRELEKIEMVRLLDNIYRLDHAVTATQKTILSAFYMDAPNVKDMASEISKKLTKLAQIKPG
jgi:transposase